MIKIIYRQSKYNLCKNELHILDNFVELKTFNRKGLFICSGFIDKQDIQKVKKHHWSLSKNGYLRTTINSKIIYLHHFIIGNPQEGLEVDHRNRNKLDNTRSNLRFVTHYENTLNTSIKSSSGIRGVCWDKSRNKWIIHIFENKKQKFLGRFKEKIDAISILKYHSEKYDKHNLPQI